MPDQIDEFESMFRRAERKPFQFAEIPLRRVTLITDRVEHDDANELRQRVAGFLPRMEADIDWRIIDGRQYSNVRELLELVDEGQTDLLVTYRHLQEEDLVPQHSLGVYLDVLTQQTSLPVLVLPGTAAEPGQLPDDACDRVMAVTDHIAGQNGLINYAVRMCDSGGTLYLCHVEDDVVFERYLDAIERIPEIETEPARRLLRERLLRDARNFIETCFEEIRRDGPNIALHADVRMGHQLRMLMEMIGEYQVELVVVDTKDEDQLAMHGLTYALSVELTAVAMLML